MTTTSTPRVRHYEGKVTVGWPNRLDGVRLTKETDRYTPLGQFVARLRPRTPDDFWRRAAEIEMASDEGGTGGPCGAGVDLYCDDFGDLCPPEWRDEVNWIAAEAAREAILDEQTRLLRAFIPAVAAIQRWAAS